VRQTKCGPVDWEFIRETDQKSDQRKRRKEANKGKSVSSSDSERKSDSVIIKVSTD
jgi:hypothetical protein